MKCLVIIAVIGISISSIPISCGWARSKDSPPLYEDPSGWKITKAVPGTEVVRKYEQVDPQYRSLLTGRFAPPAQDKYISEEGAARFYCFLLDVPEGISTLWGPKSILTVTYLCGKDTLQASSLECFFSTNGSFTHPNKLIFTWELTSNLAVPNPNLMGKSPREPVVYAKFSFKDVPDKVLGCAVRDVNSYQRR